MANSTFRLISIVLFSTLLFACSKTVVPPDDVPQSVAIDCIGDIEAGRPGSPLVIRTEAEYDRLRNSFRDPGWTCTDSIFPTIDFSRYTLLGTSTSGTGCTLSVPTERMSIVRNPSSHTILWQIVQIEEGPCMPLWHVASWVLVARIPEDYSVSVAVTSGRVEE